MADIVLNHISKSFGGKVVLRDVNLTFPQGRISALTAPSGAGKTTLLRIIMGLETPDSGTISGLEAARLGVCFQEDRLLERADVLGNLRLMCPQMTREALTHALDRFGLAEAADKRADTLSGGMRRRVALLRALLADADVLLLDEPFNGLDEATRAMVIRETLARIGRRTAIVVAHEPEALKQMNAIPHQLYQEELTMFDTSKLQWTREPASYTITADQVAITTQPGTDLWQRTYYGFRNDNAPVLQMTTDERYFSFTVRTEFDSKRRFDQCGVVMYLDSDNWLKASIEYENETFQRLGSVATNHGYSDWATTDIDAAIKHMWYRFSRRESDYCLECSTDGVTFKQMRICHMFEGAGEIRFGIYACSPEESSFEARFTHMDLTECKWMPHV